jgi:exonuclease III
MKIISWNTNSRSNKNTLLQQCEFLENLDLDLICLQEITFKSQYFYKDFFKDRFTISSFDLSHDLELLKAKRKYGELIISKQRFKPLNPYRINIPFPERVLSIKLQEEYEGVEIYTTHVPPGSSNGVIKVEHFEGLYAFLKTNKSQKILTGDFNSPKAEFANGEVITWGQKINASGKVRIAINPKWKHQCSGERWDLAERSIIESHSEIQLKDVFRSLNGYADDSGSWFTNKGVGRRYDHIFCSNNFHIKSCSYKQKPRLIKLSDHSPIVAELKI